MMVARVSTVLLIVIASVVSLWLENALQAFRILLQIGAGTGLIFLFRWFWWRINAWGEIAAMVISFAVAIYFEFFHGTLGLPEIHPSMRLLIGVGITTAGWITVMLLTRPASQETLQAFYDKIHPLGPGWKKVVDTSGVVESGETLTASFLGWFLGIAIVYSALFGTGFFLYGKTLLAVICTLVFALSTWFLLKLLPRLGFTSEEKNADVSQSG
ncbi:hypothetical protein ACFL3H_06440 [Gemmatimonadota bacterium]